MSPVLCTAYELLSTQAAGFFNRQNLLSLRLVWSTDTRDKIVELALSRTKEHLTTRFRYIPHNVHILPRDNSWSLKERSYLLVFGWKRAIRCVLRLSLPSFLFSFSSLCATCILPFIGWNFYLEFSNLGIQNRIAISSGSQTDFSYSNFKKSEKTRPSFVKRLYLVNWWDYEKRWHASCFFLSLVF